MSQEKLKDSYVDISDHFDIAWNIFLSNRQELLWLLLVINLPLAIIGEFIPQPTPEAQSETIFYSAVFLIISLILGILLNLAIAIITEKTVLGENITAQLALQQGITKVPMTVVTGILLFLMLTVGFILLVVPGIYLSVNFTFFTQAIALRNSNFFNAFTYSQNLVKGQFWRVFGRLLVIGLALFLLSVALIIPQTFLSILLAAFPILQNAIVIILNLILVLINYLFVITFTVYFLNLDYLRNGLPRRA